MANILRLQLPRAGDDRRWLAGALVGSQCSEVAAALIGVSGRGLDARADVAAALTAPVPRETATLFAEVQAAEACGAGVLAALRSQLAEVEAALVSDLLAGSGIAPSRVLALGVHDPGVWGFAPCGSGRRAVYLGLCDAARLAEATGLNVIDAFPARDVAQGGQGGPITPLAEWLLLRDSSKDRALLDLGRTVRITCLPAVRRGLAGSVPLDVISFEVGPGMALMDALARRLSGGQHPFDPGGRLAVQGRQLPELVKRWLDDPYFSGPLPRWHPRGVRPERFLADALQMAVAQGWSIRDLLCSATHFVAEAVALAVTRRLPADAPPDEIVIAGGGQHNGMLLREIGRLTQTPLVQTTELGIPGEALGPASIAVLALLYLDQVPANATAVTGAEVPRLLGRITPGSPQSWQRLLQSASAGSTAMRPLRSAL